MLNKIFDRDLDSDSEKKTLHDKCNNLCCNLLLVIFICLISLKPINNIKKIVVCLFV